MRVIATIAAAIVSLMVAIALIVVAIIESAAIIIIIIIGARPGLVIDAHIVVWSRGLQATDGGGGGGGGGTTARWIVNATLVSKCLSRARCALAAMARDWMSYRAPPPEDSSGYSALEAAVIPPCLQTQSMKRALASESRLVQVREMAEESKKKGKEGVVGSIRSEVARLHIRLVTSSLARLQTLFVDNAFARLQTLFVDYAFARLQTLSVDYAFVRPPIHSISRSSSSSPLLLSTSLSASAWCFRFWKTSRRSPSLSRPRSSRCKPSRSRSRKQRESGKRSCEPSGER